MRVRAGTSGFSYDEWRGSFYPTDLASAEMLAFYAERLPVVEINNTFYRMPKADVVGGWAARVPDEFRFVIKAPRRITHMQKLKNAADSMSFLVSVLGRLEHKLGAALFQLPPFLRKDLPLLEEFLELVPREFRAAFEFRHASWFSDDVYDALKKRDVALCVGDAEDGDKSPPLVCTASWGYLRLRADEYGDAELEAWARRIAEQPWAEVYAFLKHELRGPEYAGRLLEKLGDAAVRSAVLAV